MAAAAPHNDADTKADESKTEADREVAWHGTVKLVSQDNEELDVDSRAAEAALLVRRFLVDREADDEDTVVRFPVEKVCRPAYDASANQEQALAKATRQGFCDTLVLAWRDHACLRRWTQAR